MGSKLASVYCNTAVIENWTLDTSTEDVHISNPPEEEDDDVYFDQKKKKYNVFFYQNTPADARDYLEMTWKGLLKV